MRHWAEEVAREHLLARGYEVLAENYAVRGGEIDLVMRHGEETVFVEVRQRRSTAFGGAGESLDRRKLARLRRVALHYLARHFGRDDLPVRFDVVLIHGDRPGHRVEHLLGVG